MTNDINYLHYDLDESPNSVLFQLYLAEQLVISIKMWFVFPLLLP